MVDKDFPFLLDLPLEKKNENYTSDLTLDNIEKLTVRRYELRGTRYEPYMAVTKEYMRPAVEFGTRSQFWQTVYIFYTFFTIHDMSKWFSFSPLVNLQQWRTESWPMYLRRRLVPGIWAFWTLHYIVTDVKFGDYPSIIPRNINKILEQEEKKEIV